MYYNVNVTKIFPEISAKNACFKTRTYDHFISLHNSFAKALNKLTIEFGVNTVISLVWIVNS